MSNQTARDVQQGIERQKQASENTGCVTLEVLVIAAILGYTQGSWIIFGVTLVGLFFIFVLGIKYKWLAIPLAIIMIICWAAVGAAIGRYAGELGIGKSSEAALILGGLGGIMSAIVHYSFFTDNR